MNQLEHQNTPKSMDKPHPKIEPSLFYYYNIPLRKKVSKRRETDLKQKNPHIRPRAQSQADKTLESEQTDPAQTPLSQRVQHTKATPTARTSMDALWCS
jgi:hypothetical protein